VTGGDDSRVVMSVKGGAAKVDELDGVGTLGVNKEDILWFEVSVDESETMDKVDRFEELEGIVADLMEREGSEAVTTEVLVQGGAEFLEDHADVLAVIEARVELYTMVEALRVMQIEVDKDVDLKTGGFTIFGNATNDLDSNAASISSIPTLNNLAKGTFTKLAENLITTVRKVGSWMKTIAQFVNQMTLSVIMQRQSSMGRKWRLGGRRFRTTTSVLVTKTWGITRTLIGTVMTMGTVTFACVTMVMGMMMTDGSRATSFSIWGDDGCSI